MGLVPVVLDVMREEPALAASRRSFTAVSWASNLEGWVRLVRIGPDWSLEFWGFIPVVCAG